MFKCIIFLQIRYFSSKNEKVIDLSYADIDPVYIPVKKETVDAVDVVDEQDIFEEDQHSIDSVCFPLLA